MKRLRLFFIALLIPLPLLANNLGVVGATFEIAEMDMLDWIQLRLKHLEANGEMAKMEDEFKARVEESVNRPTPVQGITTTRQPNTFYIDPTLTLAEDINDADGNLIYPKGTKVNPFDASTWPNGHALPPVIMTKQLAFFDGDDPQQIQWAKNYRLDNPDAKIKWILINGAPADVFKQLDERIFFDQQGSITRTLSIKHVPTVSKQEGTKWKMQEFDVESL